MKKSLMLAAVVLAGYDTDAQASAKAAIRMLFLKKHALIKKVVPLLIVLLSIGSIAMAQTKIGSPAGAPDPSAILDVSNTAGANKGVLMPLLSTAQRDAMVNPATGLVIYNTDVNCLEFYNGGSWISQCASSVNGTGNLNCAAGVATGIYQVGTATTSGNYITIPVNVATTGSYSASTNTLNGVSFAGGGVFSAPGAANIVLYAVPGVIPAANGSFVYTITLGSSTCNFTVNYNSLPACTTPSPAITPTGGTICAIAANTARAFTVTGGTVNSTSFTYSISPTTGVSAPNGTVAAGTTPAITFATAGTYTINYLSKNDPGTGTCSPTSIAASQTFTVVSGPAAPTGTICPLTSRITHALLPTIGSSATIVINGASVVVTRSGTLNSSPTFNTVPPCTNATTGTTGPIFYLNGNGQSTTLSFSQPVSNLQFFSNADISGDNYTFTAKNGATDVSSSLILKKLCAADNFTLGCNSVTTGSSYIPQAVGIGGVFYSELTITQTAASDIQFDYGYCDGATNACTSPAPITVTSATTPAVLPFPIEAGNTITFTAAGGLPNTTGLTWTLTSTPAGIFTGAASGTGSTATATLNAGVSGTITAVFSATNQTAGCYGSSVKGTGSVAVLSAPPSPSLVLCTTTIGSNLLATVGATTTQTIGANSVVITRTGVAANGTYVTAVTTCGTPMTNATNFNGAPGAYTFSFSKDVSNIQVQSAMDHTSDKMVFTIYKNGVDISSQLVVTKLGTCPGITTTPTNNSIQLTADNTSGVAVSLGGVYFDRLDVSVTDPQNNDGQFVLGVCSGSSVAACTAPAAFVITNTTSPSPLPVPIAAGNTITFDATGGTPNTSGLNWTLTSNPTTGVFTGAASGTGASTGVIALVAGATGTITATFTARNASGGCNPTSVSSSQTVGIGDAIRITLNAGGCASCVAYDAAIQNTWIKITAAEYTAIANSANITGAGRYGTLEAYMSGATSDGSAGNETIVGTGAATVVALAPASTYIYAVSFETQSATSATNGFKVKYSTAATSGLTDYPNISTFTPTGTVAAATRAYFVMKTPSVSLPASGSYYIGGYKQSGLTINTKGGLGSRYIKSGDSATATYQDSSVPRIQVLGTTTKQW